jgi:hypothetical protein
MSSATHSFGSTLGVGPIGGTYVTISEVADINGPDVKVASTKVTHLTSANAFQEKIPGYADAGQLVFKLNFVKAQFSTLYGYLRVVKGWLMTFADGSTMEMVGFIVGIKPGVSEENQIMVDVTVEVTGKPVFVAAA